MTLITTQGFIPAGILRSVKRVAALCPEVPRIHLRSIPGGAPALEPCPSGMHWKRAWFSDRGKMFAIYFMERKDRL